MSEEGGLPPLTPQAAKSEEGRSKRNSVGKFTSSRSGESAVPHYLRASTGSCHDFCKYGRKHEFEENKRRPVRRRDRANPRDGKSQSSVECEIYLPGRRKFSAAELKSSSHSKTHTSASPEIIKHEVTTESSVQRDSVETEFSNGQHSMDNDVLSSGENPSVVKVKPSSDSVEADVSDGQNSIDNNVPSGRESPSVVMVKSSSDPVIKHELSMRSPVRTDSVGNKVIDGQNSIDNDVLSGRENPSVPKAKHSDSVADGCDSYGITNLEVLKQSSGRQIIEAGITDGKNSVGSKSHPRKKNSTGINPRQSPNLDTSAPGSPAIVKHEVSRKSSGVQKSTGAEVLAGRRKTPGVQQKSSSPRVCAPDANKLTKNDLSPASGKVEGSSEQNSPRAENSNILKTKTAKLKAPRASPSTALSRTLGSSENGEVRVGKRVESLKVSPKPTLASPASSATVVVRKVLASPKISSKSPVKKAMPLPNSSFTKHTVTPSLIPRKHRGLKVGVSALKNRNKNCNTKQSSFDEVEEKTLYAIKMDNSEKSLEADTGDTQSTELSASLLKSSQPNPQCLSSHEEVDEDNSKYANTETEDEFVLDNKKVPDKERSEAMKKESRKPRKAAGVVSEDKNHQPVKLNFKRGKVVDSHIAANGPRRLKFRRRAVGESQNAKVNSPRRSFKRRGEVARNTSGAHGGSEIVFLRHQDALGKKDAQILLNNVIEETASKLVETRKSKVKALVGAFETVISLQESKT